MVFSSLPFLFIFLPVSLLLYAVSPGIRAKNVTLTLVSLVFYAAGEPVFVLMLIACAFVGWLWASGSKNTRRRAPARPKPR